MVWMRKIATPELKRVVPAMKSAENGFFHHGPVREWFLLIDVDLKEPEKENPKQALVV
jgi:hypothetical protein